MLLEGELDPSDGLEDAVCGCVERNVLRYIRWEECTKQTQCMMGLKTDPHWKTNALGLYLGNSGPS